MLEEQGDGEPARKEELLRLPQQRRARDRCEVAGGRLTSESCLAHCPIQPSTGKQQKREEDMTGRWKNRFPGKDSKGVRTRWKGSEEPPRPAGGRGRGEQGLAGRALTPKMHGHTLGALPLSKDLSEVSCLAIQPQFTLLWGLPREQENLKLNDLKLH